MMARLTTWVRGVALFRAVVGVIVGAIIAGAGVMLLVAEVSSGEPVHKEHVYIAAALIGFGSLLIVPSVVLEAAKEGASIVGTYIPKIGGRRPADPPAKDSGENP